MARRQTYPSRRSYSAWVPIQNQTAPSVWSIPSAVMVAHAHRPEMLPASHLLEVQRRVQRVPLEQVEVLVRQPQNFLRQLPVMKPKAQQGEVLHSGFAIPTRYSLSTSASRASSHPASRSSSICSSQSRAWRSVSLAISSATSLSGSSAMAASISRMLINLFYLIDRPTKRCSCKIGRVSAGLR